MIQTLKVALVGQFEASLAMLHGCIVACPDSHWDGPAMIAKYPFWMVAYHTLCFVDVYMATSDEAWQVRPELHPKGRTELEEEYPSRRFEREELLKYAQICREVVRISIGRETPETLDGPSGFSWLPFTRMETHLYNLRHVQHHAGQLSAFLRKAGVETGWVKTGWKAKTTSAG